MDNAPNKLKPVLVSAAIMIVLFSTPVLSLVNLFCCAGIMFGGFAGVISYTKQVQQLKLSFPPKDAILIGLVSGIISAIVSTAIDLTISLSTAYNPMALVLESLSQLGREIPPQSLEMFEKISNEYIKFGYSPTYTIAMLVTLLILFPLFGMLGSFIAYQIYKKKNLQQPNLPNL